MGTLRWGRRRELDLGKQSAVIAHALGLSAGEVLRSPPGVHRVVVEGPDLFRPAVLCVQEGTGFPDADADARRTIASEHLAEVRELPPREVRGRPIAARLVEYLAGGSLRGRLEGGSLSVGEAVTVLLAVLDVLRLAHHAGLGGVEPRVDRIRFRADGCPVVSELPAIGPLTEELARADTEAFLSLVREVARAVPGRPGVVLLSRLEGVIPGGGGGGGGSGSVREALLGVAPPVAVRLDPGGDARATGDVSADVPVARGRGRRSAAPSRPQGSPAGREPKGWAAWDVLLDGRPLREARAAVVRLVRRRPKAILVGLVPLVAATVAFVGLPSGSPADGEGGSSGSRPGTTGGGEPVAPPMSEGSNTGAPGVWGESGMSGVSGAPIAEAGCSGPDAPGQHPTGQHASGEEASGQDVFELTWEGAPGAGEMPEEGSSGTGCPSEEDPVAAAVEWLSSRDGATGYRGAQAQITQRWGEAVLVRVEPDPQGSPDSEPASLLLVRGEAGWRIRAVYS